MTYSHLFDADSGRMHPDAPERTLSGSSCGVRHTAETLAAAREVRRQFALVKARAAARRIAESTPLTIDAYLGEFPPCPMTPEEREAEIARITGACGIPASALNAATPPTTYDQEKSRVESLRADRVVPHERGEESK